MDNPPCICPSGRCHDDALLFGIVQSDGRIGYLGNPIAVDSEFVTRAHAGRDPERRFRFANCCVESACRQWTGTGCGVIEQSLRDISAPTDVATPACGLRTHCRWYYQRGLEACRVCPLIITEMREPAVTAP